ncbi:hypothetical protein BpHYR1_031075 [Brachionus plicatilis]|uniref:Uncharacterized protein n=1 Tax=Brachionus plicatilis TaxID=10195 RepID=A0A3M7RXK2_BRAPC|nr:hypothetical protein BpHYR1_031075 [Brachionus plicatilis]
MEDKVWWVKKREYGMNNILVREFYPSDDLPLFIILSLANTKIIKIINILKEEMNYSMNFLTS